MTYNIHEFATSPVPTVVMLGGPGVPNNLNTEVKGIPVNRKADALFFLQAARIDRRRSAQEVQEKKAYEIARYVVHYADGKDESVPILSEIDVDDYRQRSPAPAAGGAGHLVPTLRGFRPVGRGLREAVGQPQARRRGPRRRPDARQGPGAGRPGPDRDHGGHGEAP